MFDKQLPASAPESGRFYFAKKVRKEHACGRGFRKKGKSRNNIRRDASIHGACADSLSQDSRSKSEKTSLGSGKTKERKCFPGPPSILHEKRSQKRLVGNPSTGPPEKGAEGACFQPSFGRGAKKKRT